jgi:hypothetical protein
MTVVIIGLATTLTVIASVSNSEFASVTFSVTVNDPLTEGVPEISPVFGLMLRPDGRPVAVHAPVAGIAPVPAVAVEGMLAASPLYNL